MVSGQALCSGQTTGYLVCRGFRPEDMWFKVLRLGFAAQMPIFKASWDLTGAKLAASRLKMDSFHLIVYTKWSTIHDGKTSF